MICLLAGAGSSSAQQQPQEQPKAHHPRLVASHAKPGSADFESLVKPFVEENCLTCHSDKKQKGGFSLEKYQTHESMLEDPDKWEEVVRKLQSGEMPPEDEPQPDKAQVKTVTTLGRPRDHQGGESRGGRSRPRHHAPPESHGIQQQRPRPARRRHPSSRRVPSGRQRLRLRQHRRRPVAAAGADGALHRGRRQGGARGHLRRRGDEADAGRGWTRGSGRFRSARNRSSITTRRA